jgi:hypothetical protein
MKENSALQTILNQIGATDTAGGYQSKKCPSTPESKEKIRASSQAANNRRRSMTQEMYRLALDAIGRPATAVELGAATGRSPGSILSFDHKNRGFLTKTTRPRQGGGSPILENVYWLPGLVVRFKPDGSPIDTQPTEVTDETS